MYNVRTYAIICDELLRGCYLRNIIAASRYLPRLDDRRRRRREI